MISFFMTFAEAGELIEKQVRFNEARINLEIYLNYKGKIHGYYVILEEAWRPNDAEYGHPESNHKNKLAVHYLIADENYNWMHETDPEREAEIYRDAHEYWMTLGGAEPIEGDAIHFSFEHDGVR